MFSQRLKELRAKFNLTQKDFANVLGVSDMTVSMWEMGKRKPESNMLMKIATYFNVSVDYLLGRDNYCRQVSTALEWVDAMGKIGINLCDIEEMSPEKKRTLLAVFKSLIGDDKNGNV
jgi:transcriptional regulator with XRE-family HTH domain